MQDNIDWIINAAEKVASVFSYHSDSILPFLDSKMKQLKITFIKDRIACDGNKFMALSANAMDDMHDIIEELKKADSKNFQDTLNPTAILTKLGGREYVINTNGTNMVYMISTPVCTYTIFKIMACNRILLVKNYSKLCSDNILTGIDEIHPDFNYEQNKIVKKGGDLYKGKKNKQKNKKSYNNIRINVLMELQSYVSNDVELSNGIIFVNDISECNSMAMNILYTTRAYKDTIVKFMNDIFASKDNYKFKAFMHNDFNVPYDFRLVKHSCLINDTSTKQPTYIANLFNTASYTPIPCYKNISNTNLLMAHPLVKLQLLYIDVYFVEYKLKKMDNSAMLNYYAKLSKTYNDVVSYSNPVIWIGYYEDEIYSKQRYTMMNRLMKPALTFYI